MSATYRVGVIGHTGRGNYGHGLDVVWNSLPGCEIVAVADADEPGLKKAQQRLQLTKGYQDYQQMLDQEKPDIVSICPRWTDQHHAMVMAAVERGIHIYLEKPFCRDLVEADAIVEACEQNNVKIAIAFQTRYSPKLRIIRQLIDEGAIGKPLELRGRGKEDRRGGGEDLWVLGSHIMNMMHFFGGEPKSCSAWMTEGGQPVTAHHVMDGNEGLGPLAGDHIQAMYQFDDDVTGFFSTRRNAGPGGEGRFGLRILGERGAIDVLMGTLPPAFILQDELWSPGRSQKKWLPISSNGVGKPETLTDDSLHAGNVWACRDLLDAIEEDRQPEANVYEGRMSIEMILSVFESHRQQKSVTIPLDSRINALATLKPS